MIRRIKRDKFGITWYIDDDIKGTKLWAIDGTDEEKKKEQKKKE